MKNTYLSTREVSDLLNVTETTVKRWTDSNRLKCIKTLGGHRKYLLQDIELFAKENNITITGVTTPAQDNKMKKLGYAVFTKDTTAISDMIFEEALKAIMKIFLKYYYTW